MIKLYLIGGLIVAVIIGITGLMISAKRAGKEEQRYETLENEVKDAEDTTKRDIKRRGDSIAAVKSRLRKYVRDK